MTVDLILIGFGNVGKRFASLLDEQRTTLARQYGISPRIVGIATRHGQTFSARGLDVAKVRLKPDTTYSSPTPSASPPTYSTPPKVVSGFSRTDGGFSRTVNRTADETLAFLRDALRKSRAAARARRLVVVETTTLDVNRGEPAVSYIRAALAANAHVITANKGPVACAYASLRRAAERADRRWLFEGAVMDGVPVFNLVRETMPAVKILGFRGIVNSTTNFILTAMEQGQRFDDALAEMQKKGIAEADASLDVDGWDAAAKAAALANVLLGARLTPAEVDREGITRDAAARAIEAAHRGRRLKLVARASRQRRGVTARVSLEELVGDDPLAQIEGQQNAIILSTDLLGEIAVVQRGGGLTHTAYALLSDLVTIARGVTVSAATPRSRRRARRG
jgi:homoserine dehydrogenase